MFAAFAVRHELLPTKLTNDYGIDFVCQVADSNESNMDQDLVQVFGELLNREGRSREIPLQMLENEELFKARLDKIARPRHQIRLRSFQLQTLVQSRLGNSALSIEHKADSSVAVILVDDAEPTFDTQSNAFKSGRREVLGSFTTKLFEVPVTSVSPEVIQNVLQVAEGGEFILSAYTSGPIQVTIESPQGETASCEFAFKVQGEETALVHEVGVGFTTMVLIDRTTGQPKVRTELLASHESARPIFEFPDLIRFLQICTLGSRLLFPGGPSGGIGVEAFPTIIDASRSVKEVGRIYEAIGIRHPLITFRDLTDLKHEACFKFLSYMLSCDGKNEAFPLPEMHRIPDAESHPWAACEIMCPIVDPLPEGCRLMIGHFPGECVGEKIKGFILPVAFRTKLTKFIEVCWQTLAQCLQLLSHRS